MRLIRQIRQHQNAKLIFWQNLQKRSKIKKVSINLKYWTFKLVYPGAPDRRGKGWNKRGRERRGNWTIENYKPGWGGRNLIWYVKIQYKEAEVFWVANDQQNTSSSSVRWSNTFNKKLSTNIRLLLQNDANNWPSIGFFILTFKTKHCAGFFGRTCQTKHTTDGSLFLRDLKKSA